MKKLKKEEMENRKINDSTDFQEKESVSIITKSRNPKIIVQTETLKDVSNFR